MRVTSVSYRRLVSRPNLQHEAVEMTGTVEDGDTLADAMNRLRYCVNQELGVVEIAPLPPPSYSAKAAEMRATLRDAVMKVEKVMDEAFDTCMPF